MNRASRLVLAASIVACALGCESPGTDVEIRFAATAGGGPASCAASADRLALGDLRVFVHNFELVDAAGRSVPVTLVDDGVWQNGDVALLDFENGEGTCRNGTSGTRTFVRGTAPPGEWTSLRFRIGVPFESNHADPAIADPPLNLGRLHWGWRAGYKFVRFEAKRPDGKRVSLHFGSTGCEGTIGDIHSCKHPNRPAVTLPTFDVRTDFVVFDLDPLVAALSGPGGDGACMGEADDPDCVAVLPVLGLVPGDSSPGFVGVARGKADRS